MMDDILTRMGRVESALGEVQADVAWLKATVPYLATKQDVGELRALVASTEASLIKWVVGTAVACAGVAFAAAKLIS
jgi:hypothetical protein